MSGRRTVCIWHVHRDVITIQARVRHHDISKWCFRRMIPRSSSHGSITFLGSMLRLGRRLLPCMLLLLYRMLLLGMMMLLDRRLLLDRMRLRSFGVCADMGTPIHACMHTFIHACMRTRMFACIHAFTHA